MYDLETLKSSLASYDGVKEVIRELLNYDLDTQKSYSNERSKGPALCSEMLIQVISETCNKTDQEAIKIYMQNKIKFYKSQIESSSENAEFIEFYAKSLKHAELIEQIVLLCFSLYHSTVVEDILILDNIYFILGLYASKG